MMSDKQPKISILIPNKDHQDLLKSCVDSILELTTYDNYEIAIIENNSTDEDIFKYYDELRDLKNVHIIEYPEVEFNYQKIINFGVENTDAEYILQLNNDIKLLTPNWLELLLEYAQREFVGAVGAKLYYPDMTIQHMGGKQSLSLDGTIDHEHILRAFPKYAEEKTDFVSQIRNVAWATGACLMVKKSLYKQVGGMDENYKIAFGDFDLCMKLREINKQIIVNPHVELIHYECSTRGTQLSENFIKEKDYFVSKWKHMLCIADPMAILCSTLWEIENRDIESKHKSRVIEQLTAQLKEMTDLYNDMTKQRDNRDDQIAAIYQSNAWKIGSKITGLLKIIKRR